MPSGLQIVRPAPFCQVRHPSIPPWDWLTGEQVDDFVPPRQMLRQGSLWVDDGLTAPGPDQFGLGTQHPCKLSLAQLSRWYWRLDQWQMEWAVKGRQYNSDTEEFDDGVARSAPVSNFAPVDDWDSMRKRQGGCYWSVSTAGVFYPVSLDESAFFSGTLHLDMGDVLVDWSGDTHYFYPRVVWTARLGGFDSPYYGDGYEASFQFQMTGRYKPDLRDAELLDGTVTIDDQAGGVFHLPIYHLEDYLGSRSEEDYEGHDPKRFYETTSVHASPLNYFASA